MTKQEYLEKLQETITQNASGKCSSLTARDGILTGLYFAREMAVKLDEPKECERIVSGDTTKWYSCSLCGYPLGNKFCGECGARIKGDEQ